MAGAAIRIIADAPDPGREDTKAIPKPTKMVKVGADPARETAQTPAITGAG